MKSTEKKHGLFWIFKTILTAALILYTLVRCCAIISDRAEVAYAAPGDLPNSARVTLTPAQTVALYGTTINCLIRLDNSMNTQTAIQFSYYDTTDNYGYLQDGGGFSYSGSGPTSSNTILDGQINTYCRSAKYLIYRADPYQWGNTVNYGYGEYRFSGDYEMLQNMISQGAANPVECHVPFSISLNDIAEFESAIFYSTMINQPPNFINTWYQYNRITYLTDIANFTETSQPGVTSAGVHVPWTPLMPIYGYDGQTTLDETRTATFSGFYADIYDGNDETFDLTGFVFDAYAVSSINPVYGDYDIWLLVACPTIVAINDNPTTTAPPVVTTAPSTQTNYPVATMPATYTNSPQDILNQNLITNNYNLNIIIGQLNLIYNQLKANGELSLRLAEALEADNNAGLVYPVNTDMRGYMENAFYGTSRTDYLSYSAEDLQNNAKAIPFLTGIVQNAPWAAPFIFLGSVGLIMIVTSFILFRGRG